MKINKSVEIVRIDSADAKVHRVVQPVGQLTLPHLLLQAGDLDAHHVHIPVHFGQRLFNLQDGR